MFCYQGVKLFIVLFRVELEFFFFFYVIVNEFLSNTQHHTHYGAQHRA